MTRVLHDVYRSLATAEVPLRYCFQAVSTSAYKVDDHNESVVCSCHDLIRLRSFDKGIRISCIKASLPVAEASTRT